MMMILKMDKWKDHSVAGWGYQDGPCLTAVYLDRVLIHRSTSLIYLMSFPRPIQGSQTTS